MDRETWEFINSFAAWFSAAGTIAAVITALYLATQDRRIHLKVTAGIRLVISEYRGVENEDLIVIRVTNVGHRSAKITGVFSTEIDRTPAVFGVYCDSLTTVGASKWNPTKEPFQSPSSARRSGSAVPSYTAKSGMGGSEFLRSAGAP